jgi:hypothetical protein
MTVRLLNKPYLIPIYELPNKIQELYGIIDKVYFIGTPSPIAFFERVEVTSVADGKVIGYRV